MIHIPLEWMAWYTVTGSVVYLLHCIHLITRGKQDGSFAAPFLCMTLGPVLLAVAIVSSVLGWAWFLFRVLVIDGIHDVLVISWRALRRKGGFNTWLLAAFWLLEASMLATEAEMSFGLVVLCLIMAVTFGQLMAYTHQQQQEKADG